MAHSPRRTIYIDAGTLGSWNTALMLSNAHHNFIANRPSALFSKLLHQRCNKPAAGEWTHIGNGLVNALTFHARKKGGRSKLVSTHCTGAHTKTYRKSTRGL